MHIYEVGDRLAHTRLEDSTRFKETLADMQASNADEQASGLRWRRADRPVIARPRAKARRWDGNDNFTRELEPENAEKSLK